MNLNKDWCASKNRTNPMMEGNNDICKHPKKNLNYLGHDLD